MAKIIRTSYTGDNFGEFLQKRGITYKAAAADLKIDKNTIGKAVRGGNLNIGVLLKICNRYGLSIEDFFEKKVVLTDENENQENSSSDYLEREEFVSQTFAEPSEEYKTCENMQLMFKEFLALLDGDLESLKNKISVFISKLEELKESDK